MKVSDAYPSKWLAASDADEPLLLTITVIRLEEFKKDSGGVEKKIIAEFSEVDKAMVVNKTNANTLAKLFGDDTDDWIGQRVIVNAVDVQFGKDMVPALRFSTRKPKAAPAKTARPAPTAVVASVEHDENDNDVQLDADGNPVPF